MLILISGQPGNGKTLRAMGLMHEEYERNAEAVKQGKETPRRFFTNISGATTDENPDAFNVAPRSLGGTTVRINLLVDDPDDVAARAIAAGATEVFPVGDQPYGFRQGRVADPDGHHWLIGKPLAR